ncbi:YcaO-like family protein [Plastoroseomonas arctica]|uniref:YcaO-like family protein n=1 Tax=Plastoroseomonas arctica TaxID=1509237 RepID=A0AAF1KNI7_9PROT|nr:YcaO-like family protein [Plastoroseomonas arctica]MBR0654643.1 YcaO-like family protein [Plastoroseomonas arctica]
MTLDAVAQAFRDSLAGLGELTVFRIDALDRTGIPVVQANLIAPGKPATTGYGYGFSAIQAEVGALGELCEEIHAEQQVERITPIRGSYAALSAKRPVIDPLTLCLPAGSHYTADMTLDWTEARRWTDGETTLLPVEWVAAYGYQMVHGPAQLITPITSGLGAGLDLEHAIAHGIMEALQRDGNVVGFRALDQGLVVEPDSVPEPEVRALLAKLSALDIDVTIKLASTDFGISNLYVVGPDRGGPAVPIQVTSCGEAAHPDRDRALRKALLEFCGSRARKAATHGPIELLLRHLPESYTAPQLALLDVEEEEPRALAAMTAWLDDDAAALQARLADTVFSESSRQKLSDLPSAPVPTSVATLDLLTSRLAAEGLEVFYVDCSPPGDPVRVVKVVVPGLEAETMSYHRIGWRGVRRLRARQDPLVVDAPRAGAKRVLLRPEDEARSGGPAWFDAALADRLVGSLYPLYREPGTFSAQRERLRRKGLPVPA